MRRESRSKRSGYFDTFGKLSAVLRSVQGSRRLRVVGEQGARLKRLAKKVPSPCTFGGLMAAPVSRHWKIASIHLVKTMMAVLFARIPLLGFLSKISSIICTAFFPCYKERFKTHTVGLPDGRPHLLEAVSW